MRSALRRVLPMWLLLCLPPLALAIDCRRAATPSEVAVCKSPELVVQDDHLNRLYQALKRHAGAGKALEAEQKDWIAQRDRCQAVDCLKAAYTRRLRELEAALAPACQAQRALLAGAWSRHGDSGPFEQFSAAPPGSQARFDSWLHQRPEIGGGRWQLEGCRFSVFGPDALRIDLVLLGASTGELQFIEEGVAGIARYRRATR